MTPDHRFTYHDSVISDFQTSPFSRRLVVSYCRIEFVPCGPIVRLRLLLTPPHDDAITFSYEVVAYPDTDFHRADTAPSWAHH